jgi:hypothetical protein
MLFFARIQQTLRGSMKNKALTTSIFLSLLLAFASSAFAQTAPYNDNLNRTAPPYIERGASFSCSSGSNPFANCGFETGDLSSWTLNDNSNPFIAGQILGAGQDPGFGFFVSAPTEGASAFYTGFDGAGPETIELFQDVLVPVGAALRFQYRAAWDIDTFAPANALDREFRVSVLSAGGGQVLQTSTILVAPGNTINLDTGDLEAEVNLSAFTGETVRIQFEWVIPESFTGPAFFQLDNIVVQENFYVPTLGQWGLIAFISMLAVAAIFITRRQRLAQA